MSPKNTNGYVSYFIFDEKQEFDSVRIHAHSLLSISVRTNFCAKYRCTEIELEDMSASKFYLFFLKV